MAVSSRERDRPNDHQKKLAILHGSANKKIFGYIILLSILQRRKWTIIIFIEILNKLYALELYFVIDPTDRLEHFRPFTGKVADMNDSL